MQRTVWKPLLLALIVLSATGTSRAQARIPSALALSGADIHVNTFFDVLAEDDDCSLREAILSANTNTGVGGCTPGSALWTDRILLPVGFYQLSLAGEDVTPSAIQGDLDITGNVVLEGAGQGLTTIDGDDIDRVFFIDNAVEVSIQHLTIQNGARPNLGGGCIWNSGIITLQEVTIRDCYTGGSGGGLLNWVYSPELVMATARLALSSLTTPQGLESLESSSFRELFSRNLLAALDSPLVVMPVATIIHSSLTENVAGDGGGVFNGNGSEIYLYNSTLSANQASTTYGGALDNSGVGLLRNVTVSGNEAELNGGGIFNDGTLDIESSTILNNSSIAADSGGNIRASKLIRFLNTLVANNTSGSNCSGEVDDLVSLGYNLDSESLASENKCNFTELSDIRMLGYFTIGPLIDNGGSTLTHALPLHSPAIDVGDDGNCPFRDQRQAVRPADGDGDDIAHCDIGAYEFNGVFPELLYLPMIR